MRPSPEHLLLLVLTATVAGCGNGGTDEAAGRPYRVAEVGEGDVEVFVEETGLVEPERQIIVKSPISGVVERLLVREGARVRPGQLLARVVPDIAQSNAFARLRSDIAAARISRDRAKREYERAAQLLPSGGITQEEVEQRRATMEQSDNQLAATEEQLTLVERSGVTTGDSAQWARISAPTGGVIIRRGVEEGETVVGGTSTFGGGTELFTIADLASLRIKAAVNEVDIAKVAEGDSVSLTLDAFPGDTVRGVVRLVPPAARQQDRVRVFDVEVAVTGDFGVLRPGMTANVRINGPTRRGVVRIPVESVFLSEGQPVVFLLVNGQPERTPVELGLGDLTWVEVLRGVGVGDSVALEDPVAAAERAARVSD
jgi:RND family efflux transporter MFP subunit